MTTLKSRTKLKSRSIAALAGGLLLGSGAALHAEPVTMFDVAQGDGSRISLSVHTAPSAKALVVKTVLAGVSGSTLRIRLDRSDRDLFSHVFTDEECRFENGSASVCEIEIKARSSDYARLVDGFKRAKLARFTVEEAGVMKMDYAVTLVGFTRALR
ncbi:MAG: hypothetical protein ACK50Q_01370 [Labrys sp. (in: a-proteobacteria)]